MDETEKKRLQNIYLNDVIVNNLVAAFLTGIGNGNYVMDDIEDAVHITKSILEDRKR